MPVSYREPELMIDYITSWLLDTFKRSGARGGIVGLSGGIDSALLAALLRKTCGSQNMLAVIMPCHSQPQDETDARLIAKALDIPTVKVDLTQTYDFLLTHIEESTRKIGSLASTNIKPRLRMTTLYAIAQEYNYLVCGATNKNELMYGYFTKHGDSGVDLLPLGDLLKGEIRLLARYLGVPPSIIEKPPSAGLTDGQTDEQEMGMTYDEMDSYLTTGQAPFHVEETIKRHYESSRHKRTIPPIACIPPKTK